MRDKFVEGVEDVLICPMLITLIAAMVGIATSGTASVQTVGDTGLSFEAFGNGKIRI